MIELLERRVIKRSREQEGLFPSSTSVIPATSGVWKGIVDQLVKEMDTMKINYEREIMRIRRKYQLKVGPSLDMIP